MKDGILILNKPQDWTSHDCAAVCRRTLRLKGVKKIGHGGTLDPMAQGVLPIFIGQATRIMEYLELDDKQYTCTMRLGMTTDTQDIWGTVLTDCTGGSTLQGIKETDVLRELEGFRGRIRQIPPVYSAVRIEGRHLYDYAYKGKSEEVQELLEDRAREVYIRSLDVLDMDLARGEITFHVTCSKGTYIRTICHDLGRRLGCGGVMTALTRTAIGLINLEDCPSVTPEEVKTIGLESGRKEGRDQVSSGDDRTGPGEDYTGSSEDRLAAKLLPPDYPLHHFGEVTMPEDRAHYFRQGNSIRLSQIRISQRPQVEPDPLTGEIPSNARGRRYDRIYRVYQRENGMFLGTGYEDTDRGELRADKIFTALNEPKKR